MVEEFFVPQYILALLFYLLLCNYWGFLKWIFNPIFYNVGILNGHVNILLDVIIFHCNKDISKYIRFIKLFMGSRGDTPQTVYIWCKVPVKQRIFSFFFLLCITYTLFLLVLKKHYNKILERSYLNKYCYHLLLKVILFLFLNQWKKIGKLLVQS